MCHEITDEWSARKTDISKLVYSNFAEQRVYLTLTYFEMLVQSTWMAKISVQNDYLRIFIMSVIKYKYPRQKKQTWTFEHTKVLNSKVKKPMYLNYSNILCLSALCICKFHNDSIYGK